jgi:excisionase family DNA binding protein
MSEILSVQDVAKRLDVHDQTVRRWLKSGQLKGMPFGGRTGWRVEEEDLREFIENMKKVAA